MVSKSFVKFLNYILSPYACNFSCHFCNVLIVLCRMAWLLALYNVSNSKYLVALCWIWCLYVEKITCCKIFWLFYQSLNSLLGRSSCFFRQAPLPLCNLDCYSHIFGMLGIIAFAFVIRFQQDDHPIFLDVIAHVEINIFLLQITFQDTLTMLSQGIHFQVPPFERLMVQSYPQLQVFFMDCLQEQKFASLLINIPLGIMRAHLHSCASPRAGVWLLILLATPRFHLSSWHFLTTFCTCRGLPHL